jgi:hypothetical protein
MYKIRHVFILFEVSEIRPGADLGPLSTGEAVEPWKEPNVPPPLG